MGEGRWNREGKGGKYPLWNLLKWKMVVLLIFKLLLDKKFCWYLIVEYNASCISQPTLKI